MKKRWLTMLAAVACVTLVCGCGANAGKESEESSAQSQSAVSGGNAQEESANIADINAADYVKLGEYKGVEIAVPAKVTYEDEDYEFETKSFYFSYVAETEGITDRPVSHGDMTNIDYVGKKDGVAFEGGTAKGATLLIGFGQFIEGFEEGLIGVMPGETVDLNLKFPEAYGNADLAGQEVVFTVTVNFIPEMQDEKVSQIGIEGVTTVEEFRQYVKDSMDEQAESDYFKTAGDAAIKQVVANSEFSQLPEVLLEKNRQIYENYLSRVAAMYGMDAASYVSAYGGGKDYETVVNEYVTAYTQESLVARVIAEKEGLVLSEEELDARLEEFAASVNVSVEELFANGTTREDFRESYLYEDVLTFLIDNAVETISQ